MAEFFPQPEPDGARPRVVVCGDNLLAVRLVDELVTRYGVDVTVVVPIRTGPPVSGPTQGLRPQMWPGVNLVEAARLDAEAYALADLAGAAALALLAQDDAGNIDAALLAEEINPALRIVVRMFNQSLAEGARLLLRDCAVLSESAIAAPGFVAAALGEGTPTYLRLGDRTLMVARRRDVPEQDVVCGLAIVAPDAAQDAGVADPGGTAPAGTGTDDARAAGSDADEPELLPDDEHLADLVLAHAPAAPPAPRPHRRHRHPLRVMSLFVGRRLRLILTGIAVMIAIGTWLLHQTDRLDWWPSLYLTVLTALGAANPDLTLPGSEQALQAALTVLSIALVPVLTAAVVDAVVRARLALATGGPVEPMRDHLVVVGLGNVGTRVLTALHEAGVAVVAVDHRAQARGVQVARDLGVPVIVGDTTQERVLRAAYVQSCRCMVVLSTDDVRNLQTALLGRSIARQLRVVLRLYDADFAARVERAFGLTSSRSVSYLAAPTFAAAMMGRAVLDTIAVRRRVLLVAEVPIGAGSALEGRYVATVNQPHETRLIAVRTGRGQQALWSPPQGRQLVRTDRLLVVCTRSGLGRLLLDTAPAPESAPRGPVRALDVGRLPGPRRPDADG